MKNYDAKGQRYLKAIHIIFVSNWIGSAVILSSMQFYLYLHQDIEFSSVLKMLVFIDDFILIPSATGTFLTGLLFSLKTKWGFVVHRWIIVKWLIAFLGIIFGMICLGPWLNSMCEIAEQSSLNAFNDDIFVTNNWKLMVFGTFQTLTLFFAAAISVIKPWKKSA